MTEPRKWTEQDEQEYQTLAQLVSGMGRFDNYEPAPEHHRRFRELGERRERERVV